MALTSLSISPTLVNPSANIVINDLTDYAAAGYTTAGSYVVNGYLKVELVSATGTSVIYDNTISPSSPDVQPLSATGSLLPIAMPQDTDGRPLPGSYIFTYLVVVVDAFITPVDTLTQVFSYDLDFDYPVGCLTRNVNCQDSKITSYDETDYGPYSTVTRVHTLYPPGGSGLSDVTGTQAVLTTTDDIYTNTWTQKVVATVTYAFPDGLNLIIELTMSNEFKVICNTGISVIYCCVKKVVQKWNRLRTTNEVAYNNMTNEVIMPTLAAMEMYSQSLISGNEAGATVFYNQIIEYTGCAEDGSCGCNSDAPQQVISAGSAASFVVDSPDNSITVTPSTSGNVTTFHIQISAAIQNLLASLFSTTITTGTPTYLQLTQSGVGSVRNYQIDFLPTALIGGVLPFISRRFEIVAGGSGGNVATLTSNAINQAGAMFAPAGAQGYLFGLSPNTNTDIAVISFYNFIADAAALDYTASANVMIVNSVRNSAKVVEAEICNFENASTTGVCDVRLYNPVTGLALTVADVLAIIGAGTMYVTLTIIAKPR